MDHLPVGDLHKTNYQYMVRLTIMVRRPILCIHRITDHCQIMDIHLTTSNHKISHLLKVEDLLNSTAYLQIKGIHQVGGPQTTVHL